MINTIQFSVGEGGRNRSQDVGVVQHLLNLTHNARGTPKKSIDVDGIAGPITIAAIREYQKRFCKVVDGRVDPNHETISRLNQTFSFPRANDGISYLKPNLQNTRKA